MRALGRTQFVLVRLSGATPSPAIHGRSALGRASPGSLHGRFGRDLGRRQLAGRSSGGKPGGKKPPGARDAMQEETAEAVPVVQQAAAEATASREGSAAESAAASKPSSASLPASGTPASSGTSASALFALPLYRKPAFPGFYQIVQVGEQEVLDFMFSLRKNGQGEYLGGFMTKEAPPAAEGKEFEAAAVAAGSNTAATQSLRRDAGKVASATELEDVGTVLQVINMTQYPNVSGGQVVVMPHRRIRRTRVVSAPSPNVSLAAVAVEYIDEPKVAKDDEQVNELHQEILATMKELLKTSSLYKEQWEQVIRFYDLDQPLKFADLAAGLSSPSSRAVLQEVLAESSVVERLTKVLSIVKKDLEFAKLQSHVKIEVEEKVSKDQRRQMLMEQMRQINKELGIEKDDKQALIDGFREAIEGKTIPEEAGKVLENELTKLGTLEASSSEYNVCRTYLEWLTVIPWGTTCVENKDITKAQTILDEDHFGLDDVKERILEHIAVSFLKETVQGKIMLLVGPPGTGKTSIGKSIARALDRKFYRFSVGGLHDVAEIRGHRRTYVGAMPGKLIQCLKQTKSLNPVILIDEIDKLGRDSRGDPSSALLEILDPEQNGSFRDHYLDVPVDLSNCLFVCTANVTDTIPGPLLDRMESIRIAGYVFEEKVAIANQYLIPQTAKTSGIGPESCELQPDALNNIITQYAREAGVRQLQKLLEKVSRKVALNLVRKGKPPLAAVTDAAAKTSEESSSIDSAAAETADSDKANDDSAATAPDSASTDEPVNPVDVSLTWPPVQITTDNLTDYIGQPTHTSDRLYAGGTPVGVVTGLAWTMLGGASLVIEACGRMPNRFTDSPADGSGEEPKSLLAGNMKVTGQLGSVMTESASISLTYSRLFLREIAPDNAFLDEARIHLNVPEGAVPKDGPSAGVTMTSSLVSLALGKPLRNALAMTGELTLTGKVLKVGGIKEKVIAARREGIDTLIFPRQNEPDYRELKEYLRTGLTVHFVDHYDDVYVRMFDSAPPLTKPSRGLSVVTVDPPIVDASPAPSSDAAPVSPTAA